MSQLAATVEAQQFEDVDGDGGRRDDGHGGRPEESRDAVQRTGSAGEFTGVYPRSSPGGWQLVGRTDATLWDVDREPPALLVPGALVRFEVSP